MYLLIRFLACLCLSLSLISVSFVASSATVFVVDQNGEAVSGAVVAFVAPLEHVPDTQTVAIMDQVNRQFLPQVLIINKGQKVRFPNSDDIRHHVYSFSEVKPFEIKLYKGSDQEPIIFDKSGISILGCNIHDNMVGHIYIAEDEIALITDLAGSVEIIGQKPKQISIWHPKMSIGSTSKKQYSVTFNNDAARIEISLLASDRKRKKRTFGSRNQGGRN